MTQALDPELFLPEPEPATVKHTVISVDDHLVEPRHMFEGRLPAKLQSRAPKVVVDDRGHEVWEFEGRAQDRSTIETRHRIGVENVMIEADYPHGDSTWPDTQRVIETHWGHVPDEELRLMTHVNAAKLFRHPLPDVTH